MDYRVPAFDEYGNPVDLILSFCWRCGVPVNLMLTSLEEHAERVHPAPEYPPSRHALREDPDA